MIVCVICAAIGIQHSRFESAGCLGAANLHLNYVRPYRTPCPSLVYLYRLQMENRVDRYFAMVLWTSVTSLFILFLGKKKSISPLPIVQVVIYDLHGFVSILPAFFTAVLISVATVVPRLSFKSTQVVKLCLQVPHVGNS